MTEEINYEKNKCFLCGLYQKWDVSDPKVIKEHDRLFLSINDLKRKKIIPKRFKRLITPSGFTGFCAVGCEEFMKDDIKCDHWQANFGLNVEHHIALYSAEETKRLTIQTKRLTFAAVSIALIAAIITAVPLMQKNTQPNHSATPVPLISIKFEN